MNDRWSIVVNDQNGHREQVLNFENWTEISEEIADQVVAVFPAACTGGTELSRRVQFTQLNKLRVFMLMQPASNRPARLDQVTSEFLIDFAQFIEPVASTRSSNWRIATSVIEHSCKAAGRRPPRYQKFPWAKARTRAEKTTPEIASIEAVQLVPPNLPQGRKSRAHLVGAAIPEAANIVTFPTSPMITWLTDDSLIVSFPPFGNREAQTLDFSPWGYFGIEFAEQVARAFVAMNKNTGNKTRITRRLQTNKFLQYLLSSSDSPLTLDTISSNHLNDFKSYLDAIPSESTRGKIWHNATNLIEAACREAGRTVPHYVALPWTGAFRDGVGRQNIMTVEVVARLLQACIKDMTSVIEAAQDPDYEGPFLAELFPFIVCFAFWTMFNPEAATGMRLSDVGAELLGRVVLIGRKPRATQDQIASFSSEDEHVCSPIQIVKNVRSMTRGIRRALPSEHRDFLFVGRQQQVQVSYAEAQPYHLMNSAMMSYYRDNFCERHDLPSFSLRDIRATGAVIANKLNANDSTTVQTLMNHMDPATTDAYTRRNAHQDENARLADQIEKRARFVKTSRARDVRDQPLAPQSAATPGFVCVDPFNPPRDLGEDAGLCSAYGACPTCPLASVDRLCGISLSFVLKLRNQIQGALENPAVNPYRWATVWKPRLKALNENWLPRFESSAHAFAMERIGDVVLPPLPGLEEA